MSSPQSTPVFDLDVFHGIALDLSFQLEALNPDGTHQDPLAYVNLTGKNIRMIIDDIFSDSLDFSSEDPSEEDSIIEIDGTPTTGKFIVHLGQDDMARANKLIGYYRILLVEDDADDIVLFRGTVNVVPFDAGGQL